MAPKPTDDITSGVTKLSLKTTALEPTTTAPRPKAQKKKSSPVADSWEDEVDEDDNGSASDADETPIATTTHAGTSAPPPTPLSPLTTRRPFSPSALSGPGAFGLPSFDGPSDSPQQSGTTGGSATGPSRRPEKTDAVARRMIASALGMKAPKATEEQRAYDRAIREKERKRREEEKERERKREEEAAKARQAIWDD